MLFGEKNGIFQRRSIPEPYILDEKLSTQNKQIEKVVDRVRISPWASPSI